MSTKPHRLTRADGVTQTYHLASDTAPTTRPTSAPTTSETLVDPTDRVARAAAHPGDDLPALWQRITGGSLAYTTPLWRTAHDKAVAAYRDTPLYGEVAADLDDHADALKVADSIDILKDRDPEMAYEVLRATLTNPDRPAVAAHLTSLTRGEDPPRAPIPTHRTLPPGPDGTPPHLTTSHDVAYGAQRCTVSGAAATSPLTQAVLKANGFFPTTPTHDTWVGYHAPDQFHAIQTDLNHLGITTTPHQ